MRIALAQVWQETNTFNPIRTTRADFEQFGVTFGNDMLKKMADTNELGGSSSRSKWPEAGWWGLSAIPPGRTGACGRL
jgi:microcystin degradation protein MlrC